MGSRKHNQKRQSDWRRTCDRIRALVQADQFILGSHVFDKLAENDWQFDEVVESILGGAILRAEADSESVDGKKYVIAGRSGSGMVIESVGKIMEGDNGRLYFVFTCY